MASSDPNGGGPGGQSAGQGAEQPRAQGEADAASHLLERLQAGDDAAFETLVRAHVPRMRVVIARMIGEHEADDVLQNAFLSAFKALPGFRGEARLSTWLHRIAVNAALMHLRRRKPATELPIDDLLPTFSNGGHEYDDPPTLWAESAEALASRGQTRTWVRKAIDELSPSYREVLLLRDIEEMSTQETAELLDISTGLVKTRLHRARQALRTLLDRQQRGAAS